MFCLKSQIIFLSYFAIIYFRLIFKVESRLSFVHRSWNDVYDYIIGMFSNVNVSINCAKVGGGTAGSVLASRLSEDNSSMILLLEAGGSENLVSDIPLGWSILRKSQFDWDNEIESQDVACFAFQQRKITLPRGKALGGSSVLGNLVYTRGNKRDFDSWFENGSIGWSWDDLFPYFLLSEDNKDPEIALNGYHGKGGYLSIQKSPFETKLGHIWIEAGRTLGYNDVDVNGPKQSGFAVPQGTFKDGCRQSIAKAYITNLKDRPNLHVVLGAFVTRILFDDKNRAFAAQFTHNKKIFTIKVRKEIILSAGTINSPQLLMLSGVGPADNLKQFGISVIVNLPVGDNLHDHIYAAGIDFKVNEHDIPSLKRSLAFADKNILQYTATKSGPLTSFGGIEGIAFVSTKYMNVSLDWPDVQLVLVNGDSNDNRFNLLDHIWEEFNETDPKKLFSILPVLLRPNSRGTVRLRSTNPFDKPVIDPKYLTHPEDIMTIVAAMKIALAVGTSAPYRDIGSRFMVPYMEECEQYSLFHDKFFACWARMLTNTFHDPVGTCRMGAENDPSSVVDSELRVIGVKGLRVVDASIMPTIVSGNTMAAVVMIAEKAADLIKGRKLLPYVVPTDNDLMFEEKLGFMSGN